MDGVDNDVMKQIENDDFFKIYLNSNSKTVLDNSLTIADQVKKLAEGIELLGDELQKQVLAKHNDLLQQASHATKLETVLNTMNIHVHNLMANAERLKSQIIVPYNELEKHTKVLSRLHLAGHILRQVSRLQQLSKRLSLINDPVQKATILQELEQLASDPELKDVDAATSELRNIRTHQQKVVQLATSSLNQGTTNENTTQTTTALQIFINLGTIQQTMDNLLEENLSDCRSYIKTALDYSQSTSKAKGGPGHISMVSSQGFRNKIWVELERVFSEDLYHICKQIKFLQLTINGLNLQNFDSNFALVFWEKFGEVLRQEIGKSSSAVQQMLEEDYPKLLKCYYDLSNKLKYEYFIFDNNVFKMLENSYLSTSLTRLLDQTQVMFGGEAPAPSHDQIDSLIRVISSELSVALVEENLSEQVSKNVSKSIQMFAVKAEQQLETGPEVAQVIAGTANTSQQKNVNLANSMYYFQTQVLRMLTNMKESLPDSCIKIINDHLLVLNNLASAILEPLVASTNSMIETIIITIHLESDWLKLPVPIGKNYQLCTPYMKELSQFITRVYQTYFQYFENKEVLTEKCKQMALRTIELFVRHTSLLRPIGQGGRLRLQSDYQHLETTLKLICPQLSDLGRPYRVFKSMASLIALTPAEIVDGQGSGSSVPHSTVLLMLFAFAGSELASPHQNTGWSLPKLSAWLDEHVEEMERLDLIAGALQRYETMVRVRNSTSFDPVYPVMSQMLETAVKENK